MRVLITGGCGFIGSNLAEYYLKHQDEVWIVDDLSTGSLKNVEVFSKNPKLHIDQSPIVTWSNLDKAVNWADCIIHMAAIVGTYRVLASPVKTISDNIISCERLLSAIASSGRHPRVLIASSSEVYGDSKQPLLKEDDNLIIEPIIHPRWFYALSKLSDEALAHAYNRNNNMQATILRLFNVIGPRQTGRYGFSVPRFIQQALSNQPITVFGDGSQTRCFCDVRDAVTAIDKLIHCDESKGQVVNVGNNYEISILDLAKLIQQRTGSHSEIKYIPYAEAYSKDFLDIHRREPDLSKLIKLTGFKPQWKLEQTLDELIKIARSSS